MQDQRSGLCECGCGETTPLAKKTYARWGHVKGQPLRFVLGHQNHVPKPDPPNPSGLCMCGCGAPAPIAATTDTKRGLVRGLPQRFVKGHAFQSDEARRKAAATLTGQRRSMEQRRRISLGIGGTGELSVRTIHGALAREHPKTGICEECGKVGKTDYAFQRHPEPYTANRDDYRELCRACHKRIDLREARERRHSRRE
jgi:hypothetical protein